MPKNKVDNRPKFRFLAMSKLIGLIAFTFVATIVIYAMVEMHISQDYSSLPQLIISAFSFAGVYTMFYLIMAKVEHVETERTKREKELLMLKANKASEEEIAEKKIEIATLNQKINELLSESPNSIL